MAVKPKPSAARGVIAAAAKRAAGTRAVPGGAAAAAAAAATPQATVASAAARRGARGPTPPPPPPTREITPMADMKRMVYTGAFAASVFMGTIYGAGLKTQQEWKEEKKKVVEATTAEKLSLLDQRRSQLMKQKIDLDIKLADLHARMKKRAKEEQQQQALETSKGEQPAR